MTLREQIKEHGSIRKAARALGIPRSTLQYRLKREHTYYVGDRSLDMQCAKNAGISGILFLDEHTPGEATGDESYIVRNLLEIMDIV